MNRSSDRDALLALFLGARAGQLEPEDLMACVIRARASAARPAVQQLPSLRVAAVVPGLGPALAALPPPLPAADGTAAHALVRITLAMAWTSGLAALDAALRRRELRGRALQDVLVTGGWPTRDALRQWVVHDDSAQLAFAELAQVAPAPDAEQLLAALNAHLAGVAVLRARIRPFIAADTVSRADAVRGLMRTFPQQRVIVFARHTETIHALWSALRTEPGVVCITGSRVRAAHGRWSRAELLRSLGPRAAQLRTDDPRAIRLVLASDLLAEGVELQGIAVLVHADLTWTPARHEQREGRLVRVGSQERTVRVVRFLPPPGSGPLLRLARRLAVKERARESAVAAAELSDAIARFRAEQRPRVPTHTAATASEPSDQAAGPAPEPDAFLAAIRIGGCIVHVAGRAHPTGWQISRSVRTMRQLLTRTPVVARAETERAIRRSLARWARRRAVAAIVGVERGPGSADRLHRVLRHRLDAYVQRAPFAQRASLTRTLDLALRKTLGAPRAAIEQRLRALLRSAADDAALARGVQELAGTLPPPRQEGDQARPRLVALFTFAGATPR